MLTGGDGNDLYVVQNAGDQAIDWRTRAPNRRKQRDFTLANHVEQLVLTGNADIDGTGNGLDNCLYGNAGINLLPGLAATTSTWCRTPPTRPSSWPMQVSIPSRAA